MHNYLGVSILSLHYAYSYTGILSIHAYPNTYMHLLPNIVPIPIYLYIYAYCPYSNYPGVNLYYLTRYAIAIGTTHKMLNI